MHYIEKDSDVNSVEDLHYLYKHADIVENNKTCGYAGDAQQSDHDNDHIDIQGTHNRIHRVSVKDISTSATNFFATQLEICSIQSDNSGK